ncbi:acyl carrier protein [Streptomyces sp. ODS28]|uniref:acyl carrier protein n=1 Tax=Streptomyces sp. ODS28 TaxID=3136688 RepID=UPI0031ED55D5
MDQDILRVVDTLFRDRLQVARLDPDTPLVNYGLDSVRSIELVVDMEAEFAVQISDEQAAAMRTLRDVVAQVAASLKATATPAAAPTGAAMAAGRKDGAA